MTSAVSAARYRNGLEKIPRVWSRFVNWATASCTGWFFSCCAISLFFGKPSEEELEALFADFRESFVPDDPLLLDDNLRRKCELALEPALEYVFSGRSFEHVRGIACLAESPTDLLMWSHYANGHRGFCMEFDTTVDPFAIAEPVIYSERFPMLNLARALLSEGDATEFSAVLDAMLLTKAKCWEYEREWRILNAAQNFARGYPAESLKAVYCGAAMSDADFETVTRILAGSPTQVVRARRQRGAFSLATEPEEPDELRSLAKRLWGST